MNGLTKPFHLSCHNRQKFWFNLKCHFIYNDGFPHFNWRYTSVNDVSII